MDRAYTSQKTTTPTRSDSGDDGVELVDVDELIRKGRIAGLGASE